MNGEGVRRELHALSLSSGNQSHRVMFRKLFPVFVSTFVAVAGLSAQLPTFAEHPAIVYSKSAPHDAIAKLEEKIAAGEVALEYDKDHGYLPALLRALDIPVSSQGLVFSRTSLQVDRIAPWTPRAIYFNDDVYVGWVQGGPIMEVASADPKLGAVFYTLDQQDPDHPTFQRQSHTCLQCHDSSSSTGGVPGFIMRSVVVDRYGYPVQADAGATTDQTPLEKRWGGWYVTGGLGSLTHMGNANVPVLAHEMGNTQAYLARTKIASTGGAASLSDRFDTDPYLSPHSDAVALLVLAHQAYVHNLITIAGYESRKSEGDGAGALGPSAKAAAERLVRGMLFSRETSYGTKVSGTSTFAADFARRGPRDHEGRSLRDFDLEQRLFRYPLSYLIYSESFDGLPGDVKAFVYQRLRSILTGADTSADFAHLSPEDRSAILSILHDTKPDFSREM